MFLKTNEQKYLDVYNEKKLQWKQNRLKNFYSIGDSKYKGNAFFKFNFADNLITFKPNKHTKIQLNINPTKSQKKELLQLQVSAELKQIPITINLSSNKITIIYSSEKLNNYAFKEKLCYSEIKNITDEKIKKQFFKRYKTEQLERKLKNKLIDVYCGVDLNPEYIGLSIRNKTKILFTKCYDLKSILKNTKGNDTNIIKYNLAHIYKDIFKLCVHFKVSHFVTEELKFKHDELKTKSFNRKTKNLWCREFQVELIQKYVEKLGIIHIEINPAYSSFVGNLTYDYFDPISASLEITRRGMIKYKTCLLESWYPDIKGFRLSSFGMHVSDLESSDLTVQSLYQLFKSRKQRYRCAMSTKDKTSKSKLILTRTFQNSSQLLI